MEFYGKIYVFMDISGHLWTFMDIYGHLWTFMDHDSMKSIEYGECWKMDGTWWFNFAAASTFGRVLPTKMRIYNQNRNMVQI